MAHVRSFSEGSPSGEYLYTIQNGKKVLLGGPYVSPEHATAMSKAVSGAVGHGSVADYRAWLMENDSMFKPDTEMRGLPTQEKTPSESIPYANRPFSSILAGVSPEDWVNHARYSATKTIPWSASNEERRAASRDKTDDLMQRIGPTSYLDKIKLTAGGGLYQGGQGLIGSALDLAFPTAREIRFPNFQDFVGNVSSIWDWEEDAN
tara:strand:- start:76 stop:693 length:618 start_codon:yes stop_codon:yes gene_type:complete